jgi:hypothetical protein
MVIFYLLLIIKNHFPERIWHAETQLEQKRGNRRYNTLCFLKKKIMMFMRKIVILT